MKYATITGNVRLGSAGLSGLLLTGCAAGALLASAPAFAQEATATSAAAGNSERVVVTGSRLRGVDPVGSPVQTIGAEDIEESNLTSVDKIIQQLPQVFDLGVSEGSRGQNGGAGNIVFGNAINLRGIGPYATLTVVDGHRVVNNGRTVDPSIIPTLGLQRIEVLTDGASAVYGSDAVAGVVNLIPKRFVNGGQAFARYGMGDDYDEHQYGVAHGATWSGGQVHLAYENGYRSSLKGADRDFFRFDQRPSGGSDYRAPRCDPGNIVMGGVSYALPGLAAGTQNLCETSLNQDLLPEQEYNSFSFTFNQDITPGIEFVADGLYSKRDFERAVAQNTGNLSVPTTNAFYTAPAGAAGAQTVQHLLSGLPSNDTRGSAENWQIVAGLNFELPSSWRLETLASYGENRDISISDRGLNNGALAAALASGNPATAYDPYGLNRTSAATIAALTNQIFIAPTNSEVVGFEARLDGALFTLPAGEVKLATGYERLEHDYHVGLARGAPTTPVTFRDFDRSVDSVYAEVYIPILSSQNSSSGQELELTVAGRYDSYSDVGETTNPKVGINYSPMAGLKFRSSYGTSLRAPIFAELYGNSSALFVQNYSNPAGAPIQGVALSGGNLDLDPEEATTWSFGVDFDPEFLPGAHFSATYWDIDYEGQIAAYLSNLSILSSESEFNGTGIILRGAEANARYQQLVAAGFSTFGVAPNPVSLFVDGRPNNLGVSETSGIDFEASQGWEAGSMGRFDASLSGTYITEHKVSITPTGALLDKKDIIFNPLDFKLRAALNWSLDPFTARVSANHVGGYTNDTVAPSQSVDAYTTIDLSFAVQIGDPEPDNFFAGGYTLGLDIRNVFDEEPPYVNVIPGGNGSGGYDASAANPVGRVIGASLRKRW